MYDEEHGAGMGLFDATHVGRAGDSDETDRRQAGPVFIAILAAGASRRMGRQKLMLPVAGGKPMLRHVVEVAVAGGSDGVIAVTGDGADGENRDSDGASGALAGSQCVGDLDLEARLDGDVASVLDGLPIAHVVNRHAATGQSTSMHTAVREVERQNGAAVMFLLGDEPEIRVEAIQAVLRAYRARQPLLAQVQYQDGFGHPVLFSARLFDELLACTGDEGGRSVVSRHRDGRLAVPFAAPRPLDIDTPDAYQALLARNSGWG